MKKVILGMSLLIALAPMTSIAATTAAFSENDFAGARIGLGYSQTSLKVKSDGGMTADSDGQGIKIELGYDFNRVIGLETSYETVNNSFENLISDHDIGGSTIKVGTDIGYAFFSENVFFKPYGKLGFVSVSDDEFDESSVFAGLGLRYQYKHIYANISVDSFFLDRDGYDYNRFIQTGVIVGYKF
ncbi:outer membrane beta-barrel protein [Psychromonas sp.]|uniref:outer membrane beta-barrel protein n=1 Tax=Psychromonas sp. TaxID=1884585 RepID=UPI0039E5150A